MGNVMKQVCLCTCLSHYSVTLCGYLMLPVTWSLLLGQHAIYKTLSVCLSDLTVIGDPKTIYNQCPYELAYTDMTLTGKFETFSLILLHVSTTGLWTQPQCCTWKNLKQSEKYDAVMFWGVCSVGIKYVVRCKLRHVGWSGEVSRCDAAVIDMRCLQKSRRHLELQCGMELHCFAWLCCIIATQLIAMLCINCLQQPSGSNPAVGLMMSTSAAVYCSYEQSSSCNQRAPVCSVHAMLISLAWEPPAFTVQYLFPRVF